MSGWWRVIRIVDIPDTTRELCTLLKMSIITLLQAYSDKTLDVTNVRIFPNNPRPTESSDESDSDEIFS